MYLYLPCTDWSPDYGGVVSYIAKDADEEVINNVKIIIKVVPLKPYKVDCMVLRPAHFLYLPPLAIILLFADNDL